MTESSPVSLYTRISLPEKKTGSTGQLVPGTQARIVSLIDGNDLGPHKSGELLIKGPQVKKILYRYISYKTGTLNELFYCR